MPTIAGIPYIEAEFDKTGALKDNVTVPHDTTDLIVMSHGWNNDSTAARALYQAFFANLAAAKPDLPGRKLAIVGVIWPSKKFDQLIGVAGNPGGAGGSAGIGGDDAASRQEIEAKLEQMKELFTAPDQQKKLDEAKALVGDLNDKASARREFSEKIRSLLDPSAAHREDASDTFFKEDGNELMKSLKIADDDLGDDIKEASGSASMPLGIGGGAKADGGAAGLGKWLGGFASSAWNLLNYTTYFEMKTRAGNVGKNGVARVIDQLAPKVQRIHLIGHSFGGRVVTAAAASSTTDKIKTMSLLQTAFSHNGFSKSMKGFFRSVVDQQRVHGPILITYTKNDKAVGMAYPLASRINGDKTAAFGDENDVFGGLGRNGAQQMQAGETVAGKLLDSSANYRFVAGKLFNLESSQFIRDHGDVAGKEIARAVRLAMAS
ncbi:alpha/beta hydrolase [soil metagenome]